MGATKQVLCLITGPSGSGKTSIALELKKRLLGRLFLLSNKLDGKRPASVVVIHQDQYFTKPFRPYKDRIDDSYENSSGIDWDSLLADVRLRLLGAPEDETEENQPGWKNNDEVDTGINIVIVEGHLLGDAAALFRKRFLVHGNVGIVAVLLEGCSQEICKRRRLERKKNRSEDEKKELANYIDFFVWPSFLRYGIHAMDTLRSELVGVEMTNGYNTDAHGSRIHRIVLLEIRNAEDASLETNIEKISNEIHKIIQN